MFHRTIQTSSAMRSWPRSSPEKGLDPRRRGMTAFAAVVRAISCFGLLPCLPVHAAQYQIEAGDVLEFSVASLPGLRQRSAVDINGDVNFPLLQDIKAAGLPLAELRTRVRELISAKPFRQRSADGRETLLTIDPDEITIGIVEYRPIYVTGDVGHPGEQQFRPGITVQQAMVQSGGSDLTGTRMGAVALQVADLRGEYLALWTELLGKRSVIERLQAELDERATLSPAVVDSAPVESATQSSISRREADQLAVRMRDFNNEKKFLAQSIVQSDQFIASLKEQQANDKQSAELDLQDFDRNNALFAKGAVPITRVMDARRALLLSSTRELQTAVQLSDSQIRKEALVRSAQKLGDQRRARLLEDLQTASLSAIELQAKLSAVQQKMAVFGKAGDPGGREGAVAVEIHRRGEPSVDASLDTELQPGDVVKVSVKSELLISSAVP